MCMLLVRWGDPLDEYNILHCCSDPCSLIYMYTVNIMLSLVAAGPDWTDKTIGYGRTDEGCKALIEEQLCRKIRV